MTKHTDRDPDPHSSRADALAEAREQALRTIRADQSRAPAAVARHLETLSGHLFEPGFAVKEIAADPRSRRRFRLELGVTPRAYRDQRLLEAAHYLVCRSDLSITGIAAGLGFTAPEAFSRWFKYRMGAAPAMLRAATSTAVTNVTTVASACLERVAGETCSLPKLRRFLIGDATPEQGRSLIRWLLAAYPEAAA